MKTFAVLLLLLNLGYLTWEQGWLRQDKPKTAAAMIPPGFQQTSQRLVLLDELSGEQLALMEQIAASQERIADVQQQIAGAQGEMAVVQDQLADLQEQNTPVAAQEDPAEAAIPVVPWCGNAGIFANQQAATSYIEKLTALGVTGLVKIREEPVSSTWWVHLPPFPSEVEARRMLAELQGKNIDSYFMRTGELAGGISLGVFSRQESALTARQQLAGRGYNASIREIFRLGPRIYVDISVPDSAFLGSPEWSDFLASGAGLQVTEKLCEVIAQENQFP